MKYLKLIGVLMIMLSIVSCTNPSNDSSKEDTFSSSAGGSSAFEQGESVSQTTADARLKNIYERLDNETGKEQLIKTEYSLDNLKKFARNGDPFVEYVFAIKEIDDTFPIECIRKVSEKFYYVVYKVKEGGYLYVHLINPYKEAWTGQNNGLELSNSYYMRDKSDIEKIKPGDSFANISANDRNISESDFNYIREYKNGEMFFRSVHIDSKKIFLITYNNSETIEGIKQSHVKSIDEYQELVISPEEYKEYNYMYDYSVLEIDS